MSLKAQRNMKIEKLVPTIYVFSYTPWFVNYKPVVGICDLY